MKHVISSKDSSGIVNTLVLEEADLAVIRLLRGSENKAVRVTISAASAHGDTIFITHKGRHYEFLRADVPGV